MKEKKHNLFWPTNARQQTFHKVVGLLSCTVCLIAFNPPANASDITATSEGDTAYFFTNYGLTTYKSKLVASNDTGTALTYGIGAHAGSEKELGFEYRVESQTTALPLTTSSITSVWTSTVIKYRLWMFELGAVIGSAKVTAKRESEEILDVVGSGYGGYGGFLVPIGKNNLLYLNAMSVATTKPLDTKARVITLGSRTDIDFGARIGVMKHGLDFTIGYRRRSNSITEAGTAFAELQTATYFGIQTGMDF
jgi:hypothetical protein